MHGNYVALSSVGQLKKAVERRVRRSVLREMRMRVFRQKHRMMFLRRLQRNCRALVFRLRFARSMQQQAALREKGVLQHRRYLTTRSLPRCAAFWKKWAGLRRTLASCRFNLKVGEPSDASVVGSSVLSCLVCLSVSLRSAA